MEHDLNPKGKQVCEDGQSQCRFLALALFRLDSVAPEENHHPRCDAHFDPGYSLLNAHSWLLDWY